VLRARNHHGVLHVIADGPLGADELPGWVAYLERAELADKPILVDLWDVTFFESQGLRALLEARERIIDGGRRFALVCDPGGPVRQLLDLTGTWETVQPQATRAFAEQQLRAT
jgi:anti-anti-sigma factor